MFKHCRVAWLLQFPLKTGCEKTGEEISLDLSSRIMEDSIAIVDHMHIPEEPAEQPVLSTQGKISAEEATVEMEPQRKW